MAVWLCFCGGVVVWFVFMFLVVRLFFLSGFAVSLRLCFSVVVMVWFFSVVLLWREVLEKRVARQVLEKSAGEGCCRRL